MPGTPDQHADKTFAASLAHFRFNEFLTLLENVADPDDIDEFQGQTLLHFAVSQKKVWAVQLLLDRGADPNLLTLNRKTALDIALDPLSPAPKSMMALLREKNAKRMSELGIGEIHAQLEKKYIRHAATRPLDASLLRAVARNHPQKEQGFVLDYMHRHDGCSPLHHAVMRGEKELVKFWLDMGIPADLTLRDARTTAQDIEAKKETPDPEMLDIIAYYREKQREKEAFFDGETADETAIVIPAAATLEYLRKQKGPNAGDTLLYRLARFGDAAKIRDIVLQEPSFLTVEELTRPTHVGRSVLELAFERGQVEALLDPRLWKGRKEELKNLFSHLGEEKITGLPVQKMLADADILYLKDRLAKKKGFRL